ncbi:MAG: RluA family pseudouridine synthase [Planctomycetota bacterium]
MNQPLSIVHSSGRFVVIDKPAGLLSVPGLGEANQDCVPRRLAAMFPAASGPLTVHRLDMETSGLLVLGLDADAHRTLSRQFEARTVTKRYVAVLAGDIGPLGTAGEVSLPMRPDIDNRPRQIVDHVHGRPALTRWRLLGVEPGPQGATWSRIEFEPHTGRSHQLRLHAAHESGLNLPIVGDKLYGDPSLSPRLLLHATVLEFDDPETGARVRVESPAPF